jgi:hypothetical protein
VADVELGQAGGLAYRAADAGRPPVLLDLGPAPDRYWPVIAEWLAATSSPR